MGSTKLFMQLNQVTRSEEEWKIEFSATISHSVLGCLVSETAQFN